MTLGGSTIVSSAVAIANSIIGWAGIATGMVEKIDSSLNYFGEIHDNPV